MDDKLFHRNIINTLRTFKRSLSTIILMLVHAPVSATVSAPVSAPESAHVSTPVSTPVSAPVSALVSNLMFAWVAKLQNSLDCTSLTYASCVFTAFWCSSVGSLTASTTILTAVLCTPSG